MAQAGREKLGSEAIGKLGDGFTTHVNLSSFSHFPISQQQKSHPAASLDGSRVPSRLPASSQSTLKPRQQGQRRTFLQSSSPRGRDCDLLSGSISGLPLPSGSYCVGCYNVIPSMPPIFLRCRRYIATFPRALTTQASESCFANHYNVNSPEKLRFDENKIFRASANTPPAAVSRSPDCRGGRIRSRASSRGRSRSRRCAPPTPTV